MVDELIPTYVGSFAKGLFVVGFVALLYHTVRLYVTIWKILKVVGSKSFLDSSQYERLEKLRGLCDLVPFGKALQAHLDSLVSAPSTTTVDTTVPSEKQHIEMQMPADTSEGNGEQGLTQRVPTPVPKAREVLRWQAPVSAKFALARANNIHHWLWSDTLRHVPGILTGVGIVGTFSGIYLGLGKMQESLAKLKGAAADAQVGLVTDAVGQLFAHVSPAFFASMICVGLAVIFTLIEKILVKALHEHATNLAEKIDHHFPVLQAETILLSISDRSKQSAIDLRSALSEIVAGKIEQSLKDLLEHQKTQTEQLAALLGSSISKAINDGLAPMADNLKEAVEQINRKSETSSNEAMKLMVQDFQKALTGSAGSEMDSLAKNLKEAAEMMAGQNSAMSSFADTMIQQLQKQGQAQEEQQKLLAQQFSATLTQVNTALNKMAEETAKTSKESISSIGDEVNKLLQRSLQMQETSEAKIRDAIDRTGKELSDQISRFQTATSDQIKQMSVAVAGVSSTVEDVSQKLTSSAASMAATLNDSTRASMTEMSVQMNSATQKAMESLTERVTASLSNMETKTTSLMRATAESQQNLVRELSALSEKIAAVSNSSTESTLVVANRTRETVNALDAMSVKLEALLGKLEPVGLGFTTAGDRLLDATANLRVHSERSAAQNELTTQLLTQVGQIHTQLQQQLSLHDVRLESLKDATSSMKQTVDSLTSVNAQVGQSLTQLTQTSERVFHSISEKHEAHGRQVAELLKAYLSQFDKSVADSCNGLQAIVEELKSALEDFRDDQKAEQRG